jgi:MoxR-like ATPase
MNDGAAGVEALLDRARRLEAEIEKRILGQSEVVRQLLITLIAGGHALVRGVPGLAKTLLVRALGEATHLSFKRVQFTPDLLPSDITGSEVLDDNAGDGKRAFRFLKGPVFVNLLLADEVNRTAPKTQAALLEAMAERQVSVGGLTYPLPAPFAVLATQNPIEQEGTYPLPEAQLDRFLLSIRMDYPSEADEVRVLNATTGQLSTTTSAVLGADEVLELQRLARDVAVSQALVEKVARLTRATRPNTAKAAKAARHLSWGAGPRGGQALLLAAKARALLDGRFAVSEADIRSLALPVLRHRLVLGWSAVAEKVDEDAVVQEIVAEAGLA